MKHKQIKLKILSSHFKERVRVGRRREYPTLFIGDKEITQGAIEVDSRIDQLIRENDLQYDVDELVSLRTERGLEEQELNFNNEF